MPESEQGARGRGKAFLGGAIAGLTHAVLMTLAFPALPGLDGVFPPSGLPAIVLFALTPLVVVARRNAAGPKRWLAMGVFAGCLPFPLGQHLWVFAISDLGAPFLVAMLALYPALFTWLFAWFTNRVGPDRLCTLWLGGSVLWVGLEVLRGYVLFDGYPWHFIGQPLIDFLFPAAGALIGLAGVSLLTAMLACSIGLLERSRRSAAVCTYISLNISAFIITSFLGGRYAEPGEDVVRVGVLQTNIPQSVKGTWEIERRFEDFDAFVLATDEMVREWEPDLIVWPETMFPGPSLERSYRDVLEAYVVERGGDPALSWFTGLATSLEQAQGCWEVPMLVGATAAVEPEPSWASRARSSSSIRRPSPTPSSWCRAAPSATATTRCTSRRSARSCRTSPRGPGSRSSCSRLLPGACPSNSTRRPPVPPSRSSWTAAPSASRPRSASRQRTRAWCAASYSAPMARGRPG